MKLTQRELEVLKLLCLSDKDIAERLIISIRTVKCHVHNILILDELLKQEIK